MAKSQKLIDYLVAPGFLGAVVLLILVAVSVFLVAVFVFLVAVLVFLVAVLVFLVAIHVFPMIEAGAVELIVFALAAELAFLAAAFLLVLIVVVVVVVVGLVAVGLVAAIIGEKSNINKKKSQSVKN